MKAVDITLLFQAIHFFIAYYMLRTYVFYPVLDIILKQEEQKKNLHEQTQQALEKSQKALEKKETHWASMVKSLYAMMPHLWTDRMQDKKIKSDKALFNQSLHFSQEQRKNIKQVIIKSVMHEKS